MAAPHHRTAIVTGAARRVGRAIAEGLLAQGWTVVAHVRVEADEVPLGRFVGQWRVLACDGRCHLRYSRAGFAYRLGCGWRAIAREDEEAGDTERERAFRARLSRWSHDRSISQCVFLPPKPKRSSSFFHLRVATVVVRRRC